MWMDFFLVHPLCAYLVGEYWSEWQQRGDYIAIAALFGMIASAMLHYVWSKGDDVESQIDRGTLTIAGYVHLPHAAMIITILILFAVQIVTEGAPAFLILGAATILTMHVMAGTQIPLKALGRPWYKGTSSFAPRTVWTMLAGMFLIASISAIVLFR